MGDSSACSDFGDCKRAPVDAAQVMRPDPAKSDGEQGSSPRALKQEGERNPSVDICSSAACNIEEGSKGQAANVNGCEQSVELMARCPSHNPNRVQRMSGCIARGLLTSDDVEASVPALGKVEPENCQHSQVCSLDQDENKSRGDTDVHKKVDNKSTVTLGGHEEDVHNENCHSDLPVNSAEAYSSFRLNLNEGFLRESSRGSHSELANKDKTLDQADSDSIHSYTGGITLDQLDDDVIYHIVSFLEARVLRFALSRVCWRFRLMFLNETYWKMRITHKWPKQYPAVTCPPDFNWIDAYVEREDSYRVWNGVADHKHHFMYSYNLFGGVDAVHLIKDGRLAVCGDRSRTLNIIDFSKYQGPEINEKQMQEMLCHSDRVVHQGWIWSIASVGNQIVTGSWDTYVRMFDVGAGCQLTSNFKCQSSVLCLYAEDNEIVASCSDKKVYFFDHRASEVRSRTFHTQPVLCVAGNEKFIISGSEDKSISVYDRRAGKIFIILKVKNYPICMSYSDNQLWFGDRTGALHLHDCSDGVFQNIGSYNVGHTEKMTGVVSTHGAIYTCSGDKTIKVLHPTREPDLITTLAVHEKEIARIDYRHGVLVSAGGDDCMGVWLPKHWDRDTYLL